MFVEPELVVSALPLVRTPLASRRWMKVPRAQHLRVRLQPPPSPTTICMTHAMKQLTTLTSGTSLSATSPHRYVRSQLRVLIRLHLPHCSTAQYKTGFRIDRTISTRFCGTMDAKELVLRSALATVARTQDVSYVAIAFMPTHTVNIVYSSNITTSLSIESW